jgi:hypothetical protein
LAQTWSLINNVGFTILLLFPNKESQSSKILQNAVQQIALHQSGHLSLTVWPDKLVSWFFCPHSTVLPKF